MVEHKLFREMRKGGRKIKRKGVDCRPKRKKKKTNKKRPNKKK